jgi:hypothetical protein
MNREFRALNIKQKAAVERAIELTREHGDHRSVNMPDGSEAYAYPHARGIAWGVNGGENGFNIARGVWPAPSRERDGR